MGYKIVKRPGPRPFKIIDTKTGKVVGSRETKAKAAIALKDKVRESYR